MHETISILLVESFSPFRRMVRNMLRGLDVDRVVEAPDGFQALDVLRQQDFGCVLTGCYMPDMDGLSLLHHIRADAQWHRLPVLVMTPATQPQHVSCAIRDGASDCVVKPFTVFQLQEKLHTVLAQSPYTLNPDRANFDVMGSHAVL